MADRKWKVTLGVIVGTMAGVARRFPLMSKGKCKTSSDS